jgi:hypothetical protein
VKKIFVSVACMALVFCIVGAAIALPFSNEVAETRWKSCCDRDPASNGWFQLGLPEGYDKNNDDDHACGYDCLAPCSVDKYIPFTLTLNIKNKDLLYLLYGKNYDNPSDVGDLEKVDLQDFFGKDNFWAGYGCHFTDLSTGVDIKTNPVPEPATLLLLGTGLIGLASLGKRIKKS